MSIEVFLDEVNFPELLEILIRRVCNGNLLK